ncbi:MAG TPA: MarR family transcriptional regulator [Actinomycetota bacterium]|nr:MarR family transcriptional regulator [Actinomycetota bacterium]
MVEDESLISAVLLASRALVAVAARSLAATPSGVTLIQYRVLVVLASRGPQLPSELAAELGVAPSSVTRLCDRLEAKGLVGRRPDDANRRQVVLTITPAGRAAVDAVTQARRREIATLVAAVPPVRRANVVQALNDLGAAAGEVPDQAWSLGWET